MKPTNNIASKCETCPANHQAKLKRMGIEMEGTDYVVALAGNPNTVLRWRERIMW